MNNAARDAIAVANVSALVNCNEIVFSLTSASRDRERLSPGLIRQRLIYARQHTERLLKAIVEAETAADPTNHEAEIPAARLEKMLDDLDAIEIDPAATGIVRLMEPA